LHTYNIGLMGDRAGRGCKLARYSRGGRWQDATQGKAQITARAMVTGQLGNRAAHK